MNTENENQAIGTNWLKFYTYVKLPLDISSAFYVYRLFENKSLGLPVALAFAIFIAVVLAGMLRRTNWGWKLNFGAIFVSTMPGLFASVLSGLSTKTIGILVLALLWISANVVYFRKRKHLFAL